jgi:ribulose-phosphate 3-epimerase
LAGTLLAVAAPQLAVSILAADQAELGQAVAAAERGGAREVHIDVMDGHFVPNLAYGPDTVRSLRHHTRLFLDVHLMVEHPDALLPAFAEAGADSITVHVEACLDVRRTVQAIHGLRPGLQAGVALNPETPVEAVAPVMDVVDRVMLMSVHPGFGGQHFLPDSIAKLQALRRLRGDRPVVLEMDGGLDADNVGLLVRNGLDVAVAGSAVFREGDAEHAARHLVTVMEAAR